MEPATYNFTIYQGSTFARQMTYKADGVAIDLTSYQARMKIRRTWGGTILLALSNAPGEGLVLAATSPNIVLTITAAQTAALSFQYAVYDLEIESGGGIVDRLLQGRVTLSTEATV